MSTAWGYRCTRHDDYTPHHWNHGDGPLRQLWAIREPLAALLKANTNGVVEISTFWSEGTDYLNFLVEHTGCPIELRNEYGDAAPVEAACEKVPPVEGFGTCTRELGHGGRHEARHTIRTHPYYGCRLEW